MWSSQKLLSSTLVSCWSDIQPGFWSLLPYLGDSVLCLPRSWLACHSIRKELSVKSTFLLSAPLYKRLDLSASGLLLLLLLKLSRVLFGRCGGKVRMIGRSYWREVKVIVDLHQGDVELGDLKDTGRLVRGRIKLLKFELPLQALHCIESGCFMLLPHQKTRL